MMDDMVDRITGGQKGWANDISRKKKWASAHKNNQELSRMAAIDVALMNIIAEKEKEHLSYKSSPERTSFRKT